MDPSEQTTYVSVDNYNPSTGHKINSPRSLEAMRIVGIVHDQIAELPDEQYLNEFQNPEDQSKLIEHYQQKRGEFLQAIGEKRDEIMKNGGDAMAL